MKRLIPILLLFFIGLAAIAYPGIAEYVYEMNGSFITSDYDDTMAKQSKAVIDEEWQEAVTYNESLSGNPVHDPFLEGSGMAMQDNYEQVLDLTDTMAYIEIPKISASLPVYHGTEDSMLQKGVGHLEGSSMPIGGAGTHAVLAGHSGLTHAKLFTNLTELKEGDLFYIHVLDQTLAYRVDQISVVLPDESDGLRRVEGKDYVTLLTCTPYGINSHRLLVRGERTDYNEAEKDAIDSVATWTDADKTLAIASCVTAGIMIIAIITTAVVTRKRKKRDLRLEALKRTLSGDFHRNGRR